MPTAEDLKNLWALLGGSANQGLPESVFETASEFAQGCGWDILLDSGMGKGDLYYQEWNAQMLAVITVLNEIAQGRLSLATLHIFKES
jgi:hypothetical protein